MTTEAGGVTPAKSNIRAVWAAVDQPGADTFLYLGFIREASSGTSFLTFELNHDDRLWDERLFPATDPGRFDLLVDGQPVVEAGGDRASATVSLAPGSYTVAERAAAGTSLADYRSAVSCRSGVTRFERLRRGASYEDLPLAAGQLASCTFCRDPARRR